jgi:hypothetical protein
MWRMLGVLLNISIEDIEGLPPGKVQRMSGRSHHFPNFLEWSKSTSFGQSGDV